jgi:hypothetical protein
MSLFVLIAGHAKGRTREAGYERLMERPLLFIGGAAHLHFRGRDA